MVEYVLALLDYTKRYKPYKKVLDYIADLSAEQEENEKLVDDEKYSDDDLRDEKVCICCLVAFTFFMHQF